MSFIPRCWLVRSWAAGDTLGEVCDSCERSTFWESVWAASFPDARDRRRAARRTSRSGALNRWANYCREREYSGSVKWLQIQKAARSSGSGRIRDLSGRASFSSHLEISNVFNKEANGIISSSADSRIFPRNINSACTPNAKRCYSLY